MITPRLPIGARPSAFVLVLAGLVALSAPSPARAQGKPSPGCDALPSHDELREALKVVVAQGKDENTGMGNQRWAAVVNRDGIVCAVVFSGKDRSQQWPGSRPIAAQKAHTANALSGPDYGFSTANLYWPAMPGQSLYSLATSAPPNPDATYAGPPERFGTEKDPMIGKPVGGVIVFAGGLPLYDVKGKIVGGLGVSGDTSCSDHVVAWKVRHRLNLDAIPGGPAKNLTDNMIFDIRDGVSVSGFGHPPCKTGAPSEPVVTKLPERFPTGPNP